MKVPLLDLQAQYDSIKEELNSALRRVMDSQQFIMGPDVRALEDEVISYTHARHAIACASGSDALLLALMALDVKADDEIITTPYSFFATAAAVARLGARPVFVDIEPDTYNLDVSKIEAAVTERTRAIMPVHLYGQCAEMNAMMGIAESLKLPVIEDAAQAIGATDGAGRQAGTIGAIGCFSFYPSKNLGASGDGGMLTANDDALAERLRMLRVHGSTTKYYHSLIGINSRLDSLQAAILRVKLPYLDKWSDARRANAERYDQLFIDAGLTEVIGLPAVRDNVRHIFNQYVIRVRDGRRDQLREHLKEEGVGTDIYYPVPLHLQECFAYLDHREGDFPEAERAARETIALPIYPELTAEQQGYVVESIRGFYG
ncbi:MAG TPA: DegT/DnrJ/EryC1/StrS family aminotransferase [Pyrinomonadaceae bacterium]|nr:DegT/DnrJ/EryC1/StrS family aminotransferase [Pyrinomonadaceae bacterium]